MGRVWEEVGEGKYDQIIFHEKFLNILFLIFKESTLNNFVRFLNGSIYAANIDHLQVLKGKGTPSWF